MCGGVCVVVVGGMVRKGGVCDIVPPVRVLVSPSVVLVSPSVCVVVLLSGGARCVVSLVFALSLSLFALSLFLLVLSLFSFVCVVSCVL